MSSRTACESPADITSDTSDIRVLLLENIHDSAVAAFDKENFKVDRVKGLTPEELEEKIQDYHVIGVRSKTKLTKKVLEKARNLIAIGCFCIGTDQTDLEVAEKMGIPVFNSPFANTRSVAELILSEVVMLAREAGDRNREMHDGKWNKVSVEIDFTLYCLKPPKWQKSQGCHEVRGKTLGIIGYGHVGSQVSILAEGMGMQVIFYDIIPKLPLGNSRSANSMEDVLKESDFVTLHVPRTPDTHNMITEKELSLMKDGSYLLNASRGTVVDVEALARHLKSGHLSGAAIDVFPVEPGKNGTDFESVLQKCPNTILTPHIGGSTEEAQANIGEEVAASLTKFVTAGATTQSVNFPSLELVRRENTHRIINVHVNKPGVLRDINTIVQDLNVSAQVLGTTHNIGYIIIDIDSDVSRKAYYSIKDMPTSIMTRIIF